MPTTGSTATRAADSAVVTPISSFYNQSEGTVFTELVSFWDRPAGGTILRFSSSNGSVRLWLRSSGANAFADRLSVYRVANGVNGAQIINIGLPSASSTGTASKIVVAHDGSVMSATRDGRALVSSAASEMPTNLDTMFIGSFASGSGFICGHIRKVAYWPKRLTNELIQQLTT
jgi:hypothetical protein